jgi:ATPase subunit of ABC transporter with duplicated ATPase domains
MKVQITTSDDVSDYHFLVEVFEGDIRTEHYFASETGLSNFLRHIFKKKPMSRKGNYKEYQKEYQEKNKEKLKEYQKEYQEKNKEKLKASRKEYKEKNRKKQANRK